MERIAEFLQTNPLVIITTFVIGLASIAVNIAARRKQLWQDFLAKRITLPVYVYLILVLVGLLVTMPWPATEARPKRLRTIEGETFGVQSIPVDGNRFVKCEFNGTELVYSGEGGFGLEYCTWKERPRIKFDGAANRTVRVLQVMYRDPMLRPMVEGTWEGIKTGKLREVPPPSPVFEE